MLRNLECGLGTGDRQVVKDLAESLLSGFDAKEPPREMSHDELEALYAPLETIRATLPKLPQMGEPLTNATFSIFDKEAFLNGYAGWQRLTLEGVLAMPRRGFQLGML